MSSFIDNWRGRLGQVISGGYDFADTLHNIYLDYGYPQELDFFNYWNMYRRFGIARNVVELPAETGWMQDPVIEGSDAFNRELEKLDDLVMLFDRLKALDTRQRVARYAGLFIRVRDGKPTTEPIDTALAGHGAVISLMPIYENNLTVSSVNQDPLSDEFGMPTLYNFNSGATGNRNDKFATSFNIHPDRLVIASEGADQGGIYGISSLEAPYNSLMDLRKIIGAGGEGFYKNAAQSIVFTLKDVAGAKGSEAMLEQFNENYDEFANNRFRRAMWTPGLEPNALESNLINPKEFFNNALNDVAAASKIPATILIGAQTGRLASSEDSKHFLSIINSRRQNFMSEMIRNVIDWFIRNGVLPASDYDIEWDDLLALSQEDRLKNAKSMGEINQVQFTSGGDIPFAAEEIREEAGFDPEEMPEIEGEDITEDEDDLPALAAE